MTPEQVAQLLKPINPRRVKQLDGMSHLEAYDVRAHLTRIFGFCGWSAELTDLALLFEQETTTKAGKPAYKVAYRATVKLTIHEGDYYCPTYTEAAAGESLMPDFKRGDAHDMAIKTAESQALKRCAANLGDQFGLSLYNNGSQEALVGRTLVAPFSDELHPTTPGQRKSIRESAVDDGMPDLSPEQQQNVATWGHA